MYMVDVMKSRVLSAAIMIVLLVPFVIIGGIPFRVVTGIIAILAYREIINLKGEKKYPKSVLLLGLVAILLLTFSNRDTVFSILGIDYKYLAFTFLLMFIPTCFYYGTQKYTSHDALFLSAFIMFIGITLNLIGNILIYNKKYFFMLLIVTVLTDTFAYLTGMAIGKHKFTKISPNKTIEGCIGGLLMGSVLTTIFYTTFIGGKSVLIVFPLMLLLSLACEVGDLFFSLIKRENNIKDFSNLIPGHGGVLDRIDSLTFVIWTFMIIMGLI